MDRDRDRDRDRYNQSDFSMDFNIDDDQRDSERSSPPQAADYAYWPQRVLREAIYGEVWKGQMLKRVPTPDGSIVWEITPVLVAIKAMNLHQILEQNGSAEDPWQEIAAMQYLQTRNNTHVRNRAREEGVELTLTEEQVRNRAEEAMLESHVMMPLDVLTDNTKLYSIMPFCNGGELFDVLENRTKFTEEEARYWFVQILNGIETMQRAGICHRDISLENLLTNTDGKALIIDLGMCIKIPYLDEEENVVDRERQQLDENINAVDPVDYRTRQRCLMRPQQRCGKVSYFLV